MISEITLQNLHRQLAYHQERTGLSVEITHGEKRTMVSIDHGKTCFLPDSARHVEFDQMVAHYPVPVTVNGNPLSRRPYRNEAGISRSGYDGDIPDTRFNSRKPIAGPYQGAILLDGVLYAIGPCPDLKADHRYNSVTTYLVPDRQDEQPHYARSSEYYIQPNYRLDIGNGAAGWVFEGSHRRIQCQPPLEVCVSLQAPKAGTGCSCSHSATQRRIRPRRPATDLQRIPPVAATRIPKLRRIPRRLDPIRGAGHH